MIKKNKTSEKKIQKFQRFMEQDKERCYFPLNSPKLKVYMENVDKSIGNGKRKANSNKETAKKAVSENSCCNETSDTKANRKRGVSTSAYSSVTGTSVETKDELPSSKEKELLRRKSEATSSINSDQQEHTESSKVTIDANANTSQTYLIKKEDNDRILERLTIVSGSSSTSSRSDGVTLAGTQNESQQPSYLKKWLTKVECETHKNIVIEGDTVETQTGHLNMLQRYTPYVCRKKRISEGSRISMELTPTKSLEPSFVILESKQDIVDDKADIGEKKISHMGKSTVCEVDSAYSSPLSDENDNKTNENFATYLGIQEKERNSFNSSLDMIDSLFEGCSPVEGTYAKELLEKSYVLNEDDFNFDEIDISKL